MKRIVVAVLVVVGALAAVVMVRAVTATSVQQKVSPVSGIALDRDALAQTLSRALAIKSISYNDPKRFDTEAFGRLHAHLEASFPHLFAVVKKERFLGLSLLLTWPGSDPKLKPALMMAHTDVVPVEKGTEKEWKQPPFSGAIADGHIWGRGALDVKGCLIALLAAADKLAADGFSPKRTLYFALGHDEEVNGSGNRAMAAALAQRKVELEFVLDEGLLVTDGVVPGLSKPAALVGISEKGFFTLTLTARGEGGHSSRPPKNTAVGILARAITRLEEHPMEARISRPTQLMFDHLGPEMDFGMKLVMTNLWLLSPVLIKVLSGKPSTNASVRTTTAATMLRGSPQDNVLPIEARAWVNFRILPGQTRKDVVAHANEVIDDSRVTVAPYAGAINSDPPPVSSIDSKGYKAIGRAIREIFPGAHVAPGLMIGTTDSKSYTPLTQNIYRFIPVKLDSEGIATIHATNERIGVDALLKAAKFYAQVIRHAQ